MQPFFIEISKFWADIFWGIWGIFGRFISTHFGTVSPLPMSSMNQPLYLQKTRPLYPVSTSQIFICDWDLNLNLPQFGPQRISNLAIVCP